MAEAHVAVRALSAYRQAVAADSGHEGVRLVLGYAHLSPCSLSPVRMRAGARLMAEAAGA
ncbi:hypothetical protein ACFY0A_19915 [Streptomyces sp. NPDC001698]|uniref:hypothetical protein n=1 Tax=unclassified Streptomyces TaxID=2593676 RepID=UPI0036ABFD3B